MVFLGCVFFYSQFSNGRIQIFERFGDKIEFLNLIEDWVFGAVFYGPEKPPDNFTGEWERTERSGLNGSIINIVGITINS